MTHKLVLKVQKFYLYGAERFGTVETSRGVDSTPYHLGLRQALFEQEWPKICNFSIALGSSIKICTESSTPAKNREINDFFYKIGLQLNKNDLLDRSLCFS